MVSQYLQVGFHSSALEMSAQVNLIIPQKMWEASSKNEACTKEYPTVYLLHGYLGDHTSWQRASAIERYAAEHEVAVVIPSVERSWYSDTKYGYRFLTYICEELPYFLATHFKGFSTKRETTFVGGLSMGGYGAMKVGLTRPDRFGAIVSLSSAFDVYERVSGAKGEKKGYWTSIFGEADEVKESANDVYYLAQKIKNEGKPLPKIQIWCGTEDPRLYESQNMRDHLLALGYDVFYSESAGDHSWPYWDQQIALAIPRLLGKEAKQ